MKTSTLTVILCTTGLIVGAVVGRSLSTRALGAGGKGSPLPGRADHQESNPAAGMTPDEKLAAKRDFGSLVRRYHRLNELGNLETRRELERMEDRELKGFLQQVLAGIATAEESRRRLLYSNLRKAAAELYRRNPDGAMAWARAIEDPLRRRDAVSFVLGAGMREDPIVSKQWYDDFVKEFGAERAASQFTAVAHLGATSRGADELVKFLKLYNGQIGGVVFPFGPLPEGFDFPRLVAGGGELIDVSSAVQYWAAKDKEAAWKGVKETMDANFPSSGGRFGPLFIGVAAVEGDEAAAKWMVGKLAEVPGGKRTEAIQSLASHDMSKTQLVEVMKALPSEGDREILANNSFTWLPDGLVVTTLMGLGSEEAQLKILLKQANGFAERGDQSDRQVQQRRLTKVMDEIGMSESSRAEVRKAMGAGQ